MLLCYTELHENIKKPFENLLITFAFLVFSGVHCVYHGWGYGTDENGEIYLYWDEETIYDVNEILD